jgi:type IV pilus assembly protein PilO
MAQASSARIDYKALAAALALQFRGLDPRNPPSWPVLPRVLLLVAVSIAVVGVLWYFPLSDFANDLEQAHAQEAKLREDFSDKLRKAASLKLLKKQRDEVAETVEGLEKLLPNKAEMAGLLSAVNQAGVGRDLQFELFRPGPSTLKTYYAIIPVSIRVVGGYHHFASFAADVAQLPRIVTLSNIAVQPKAEGVLAFEATVKTYRYLDAAEVVAQKAASAPGAPK